MLIQNLIKSMKNSLKYMFSDNVRTRVTFLGTRLSNKFTKIKDKTVKENQYSIQFNNIYSDFKTQEINLQLQKVSNYSQKYVLKKVL